MVTSGGVISYPLIPVVRCKRVRPEVDLGKGTITIVFDTQNWEQNSIRLTVEQFEDLKGYIPAIMSFIDRVQRGLPIEGSDVVCISGTPWKHKALPLDENILIRLRWNEVKHFSLVTMIHGERQFTMSAGAFTHFKDFTCPKLTNAVRMWQDMLACTETLRASMLSDFKPECYFMSPRPTFQDPVQLERFCNDFFSR